MPLALVRGGELCASTARYPGVMIRFLVSVLVLSIVLPPPAGVFQCLGLYEIGSDLSVDLETASPSPKVSSGNAASRSIV